MILVFCMMFWWFDLSGLYSVKFLQRSLICVGYS